MAISVAEVLQRARRMLDVPTLYWIGKGGWVGADDAHSPPGEPFDLAAAVDELPRVKREAYLAKAQAAGIDPHQLPPLAACDCSGFVWWALRQPRSDRNTDWIWNDARRARTLFGPVEVGDPLRAREGALLVYPRPPATFRNAQGEVEDYGHIGVVTQVDADGRATRVIHCAAENFLCAPQPDSDGRPRGRNAIAETGPERFLEHARIAGYETRAVWYKQISA
jgi:hypothetical protein